MRRSGCAVVMDENYDLCGDSPCFFSHFLSSNNYFVGSNENSVALCNETNDINKYI